MVDFMTILVCGSREWTDRRQIAFVLRYFVKWAKFRYDAELLVIHGDCIGADQLADSVCRELQIDRDVRPAKWRRFRKAAGPIRNRQMLDREPILVVAFHDDLENSRGTKDCVEEAGLRGTPVLLWTTKSGPQPTTL